MNFVCHECLPLSGKAEDLLTHAKMYETGDKLDVIGLKSLAEAKFSRACLRDGTTSVFAAAADHAFQTTPDSDKGLRNIVIKTIFRHLELVNRPEI